MAGRAPTNDAAPTKPPAPADLHDQRGRLYEALALLLRYRPTEAVLSRVRELLGGDGGPAADDLREAALAARLPRAQEEYAYLFDGPRAAVGTACAAAASAARVVALGVANVAGADHGAELQALSTLARRVARALRNGDLMDAARLGEYRARLLREHARACLAAFADDLMRRERCPLYVRVGRALGRLLEDETQAP